MGRDRRRDGLTVWKDGKNVSGYLGPFLKRVQAAAVKQAKRKGHPNPQNLKRGDTSPLWAQPIPDKRRCDHVYSDTGRNREKGRVGQQCKRWAMHGASRCNDHGGYRQNPEHPATVRRLADIEMMHAAAQARIAIHTADPHIAQHVKTSIHSRGLPLSPQTIAAGIDAITRDDNGKAWRRYLDQLTAPTSEQRARKEKK
jgi:hypothetical protein